MVGVDVVEVAPAYDHAELTVNAAHRVVFEALAGMAARRRDAANIKPGPPSPLAKLGGRGVVMSIDRPRLEGNISVGEGRGSVSRNSAPRAVEPVFWFHGTPGLVVRPLEQGFSRIVRTSG